MPSPFYRSRVPRQSGPVFDPTPLQQAYQQEAQASDVTNQLAEQQDIIVQQQREANRLAKEQAAAGKTAARDAAKAHDISVKVAKSQGVETVLDPATGKDTIRTTPDGAPVWQSGFQGGPKPGDDGRHVVDYRDTTGQTYRVPVESIRRKEGPTGAVYEFDVPGQDGKPTTIRRAEEAGKPLFKIDEKTGMRYAEAQDQTTGGLVQQPIGYDPAAANKAAIAKVDAEWEQQKAERTFKADEIRLKQQVIEAENAPSRQRLRELEQELKKFDTTGQHYAQDADGTIWERKSSSDTGFPVNDNPASLLKAQSWLTQKKRLEADFAKLSAEQEPITKQLQEMEVERNKVALSLLQDGHRVKLRKNLMEKAAEKGAELWKAPVQKRIEELVTSPAFTEMQAKGETEGTPMGDDIAATSRNAVIDSIGSSLGGEFAPLPDANAIGSDLNGSALKDSSQRLQLDAVLATSPKAAKLPDGTPDIAGAAKALGIEKPEDYDLVSDGAAFPTLVHRPSGENLGYVDTKGNRLMLMPGAVFNSEEGRRFAKSVTQESAPAYLLAASAPFTARERADYFNKAIAAAQANNADELQAVGADIPSIRRNVRDGKLSIQDAKWLTKTIHGIEEPDLTAQGLDADLKRYLAASKVESALWNGPEATPESRAEVVNRFMDGAAQKAQGSLFYNPAALEEARTSLLAQHSKKGAISAAVDWLADTGKMLVGSITGLAANTVLSTGEVALAAGSLGGYKTSERFNLFVQNTADWMNQASKFANRVSSTPAMQSALSQVRNWTMAAEPGDQPPAELLENLAKVSFDTYHQFETDAEAKSRATSMDTFHLTKDPTLAKHFARYLETRNPAHWDAIKQLVGMDQTSRMLADKTREYITQPRAATVEEVRDRARVAFPEITDAQAQALAEVKDEAGLRKVAGMLGIPEQDAALALDLFTGQTKTDETSLNGYFRSGMQAPLQEIALEAASTALTAGFGKLAARGFVQAAKGATVQATRRAAAASWVATQAAKLTDDFAKLGMIRARFGQPLTRLQRLSNATVTGAKAVSGDMASEGFEEGAMAIGQPGSDLGTVMQSATEGALAAPLMLGGMTALALPLEIRNDRRAARNWEAYKATYLDNINKHLAQTPGTAPLSPDEFEVALALYGNNAALADAEAINAAMQAMDAGPPSPEMAVPIMELVVRAKAREALAINAAIELRDLTEEQRTLYTAVAKAALGVRQFTIAESQSLNRLGGDLAVRLTAAPGLSNVDAYGATDLPGRRQSMASGAVPVVPPALVAQVAQSAPSLAELIGMTPVSPDQTGATIQPPPAQNAPGTNEVRGGSGNAPAATAQGVVDPAQGAPPATPAVGAPALAPSPSPSAKLPRDLRSAKPRYGIGKKQFDLSFDSDFDKAAYIAAQPKPSKRDADYVAWAISASGMTEGQIRQHGRNVRAKIKEIAKRAKNGDKLQISDQRAAAPAVTPPANQPAQAQPPAPVQAPVMAPEGVEKIARRVIADIIAKAPKLKKLVSEAKKAPDYETGGMWLNPDGSVAYHIPTLQKQLSGLSPQQIGKRIEALMDEEIRHAAHWKAAERLYQQEMADPANLRVDFVTWRDAWYGNIWQNEFTDEMRARVEEVYGDTIQDMPDWVKAMEGLRMGDQLRATGSVTEAVLRHLEAVLAVLKEAFDAATPIVKREIEAIQAMLVEFGYEAGQVKPNAPQKPAQPKGKRPVGGNAPAATQGDAQAGQGAVPSLSRVLWEGRSRSGMPMTIFRRTTAGDYEVKIGQDTSIMSEARTAAASGMTKTELQARVAEFEKPPARPRPDLDSPAVNIGDVIMDSRGATGPVVGFDGATPIMGMEGENAGDIDPEPAVGGWKLEQKAPEVAKGWAAFPAEMGGLSVPRASMPQIATKDRGAMVQFLKGRGITHSQEDVLPGSLKPSQVEYSPEKVAKAKTFEGPNRSILISADDHVVDGHHQWMAAMEANPNEPYPVIRLNAPIQQLLIEIARFPSAGVSDASEAAGFVSDAKPAADTKSQGEEGGKSNARYDAAYVKSVEPVIRQMIRQSGDVSRVIDAAAGFPTTEDQKVAVIVEWTQRIKERGERVVPSDFAMLSVEQAYQLKPIIEALGIAADPQKVSPPAQSGGNQKPAEPSREEWQKTYSKFKRALAKAVKAKDYAEIIRQADAFQRHYETDGNGPFPDSWSDWERHKSEAEMQLARQGKPSGPLVVPILKPVNPPRPAASQDAAYIAAQDATREALAGLFSAPAYRTIPQLEVSAERFDAVRKAAVAILAANIRTPEAFARFMDDTFPGGKARPYSEAIWDMIGISDKSLRGSHDWSRIYSQIDEPLPDVQEPPEAEIDAGADVTQNAGNETSPQLRPQDQDGIRNVGDMAEPTEQGGQPGGSGRRGERPPIQPENSESTAAGGDSGNVGVSDVGQGGGNLPEEQQSPRSEESGDAGPSAGNGGEGSGMAGDSRDGGQHAPGRGNYYLSDPESIVGGGPKARFRKNKAALELLDVLQTENREPTDEELNTLAAYTGWGALGQELFKGSFEQFEGLPEWREEAMWLRDRLGKDDWTSAQDSILNAHYTDPPTVSSMWEMVRRMGFAGGRVLEPSEGIGNFFSLMPRDLMEKSQLTGIEMDPTTSAIAKMLHPKVNHRTMPYQHSTTSDNFYDLAIGNWPFSNNDKPADRRWDHLEATVHNFFFIKALAQVRPGGLVVGITSTGTMDSKSSRIRKYLAARGELVAAFRLPSGAFGKYAGTKVVTDLIILRKREKELETDAGGEGWINSDKHPDFAFNINEYYLKNPSHILGKLGFGHGTTTGRPGMIVDRAPDYETALANLKDRLPEGVFAPWDGDNMRERVVNNTTKESRQNTVVEKDDELYTVNGESLVPLDAATRWKTKTAKTNAKRLAEAKSLIALRSAFTALMRAYQTRGDSATQRAELKAAYEAFRKAHGNLSDSMMLKKFEDAGDPYALDLRALVEVKDGVETPRAIMERDIMRTATMETAGNIADAYAAQRANSPDFDAEEVAKLAGVTPADVIEFLSRTGTVFKTPTGVWQPGEIYLSGNVRRKLREAEAAKAEGVEGMDANIEALRKIVPADVPYYAITTQMGVAWIPLADYKQFILEKLNGRPQDIQVSKVSGGYNVSISGATSESTEARSTYNVVDEAGEYHLAPSRIFQAAMNGTAVEIKVVVGRDDGGKPIFAVSEPLTRRAMALRDRIRNEFSRWVWEDESRAARLSFEYNEAMNAVVNAKFDGGHLTMPGLALSLGSGTFDLRKHQLDAIWRGIVNRKGVYAHEVGTGKTFTMAGIAIEGKRQGRHRKPLLFAHNANSKTVADDFRRAYPGARVLYLDSLSPSERNLKLRQIASDDWDAVVVPHSLIDRFGLKRETIYQLAQKELDALESEFWEAAAAINIRRGSVDLNDSRAVFGLINQARGEDRNLKRTAKELASARRRLVSRIESQASKFSKPDSVFFEDLGVDAILVDEAHIFKKISLATRKQIKGLNKSESGKGFQLGLLTDYLKRENNGYGVHLFTGTPVTNTLNEVFNMMRYVMHDEMSEQSIESFDDWYNNYAKGVTDIEPTSGGTWEAVERLRAFLNIPELARLAGQVFDVVRAKDMPEFLPRPSDDGFIPEGQKAEGRPAKAVRPVVIEPPSIQKRVMAFIRQRFAHYRDLSNRQRGMLKRMGGDAPNLMDLDGKNAALDPRLVDPYAEDDPNSKVNTALGRIMEHYSEHPKSTQMVFLERGASDVTTADVTVYGADGPIYDNDGNALKRKETRKQFNVVRDMVEKMIAQGVKPEEIAVFHNMKLLPLPDGREDVLKKVRRISAATPKDELAAMMNRGEIRIAFGGTETMGTGVNAQEWLRAMHHLDVPWMPGELEQRNGRGHRQGNRWNTVYEYRYTMEGTHDGKMWSTLLNKVRFIERFTEMLQGRGLERVLEGDGADAADEEDGASASDFEQMFSKAAGDPRILLRVKMERDLEKLRNDKQIHYGFIEQARRKAEQIEREIPRLESNAERLEADFNLFKNSSEGGFRAVLRDKTYTDRAEFDEALKRLPTFRDRTKIGTFAGFDIYVVPVIVGQSFELAGPNQGARDGYLFSTASAASMEGVLRGLSRRAANLKEQADKSKADVEKLQARMREPFPAEKALDDAEKAYAILVREIVASPTPAPGWLRYGAPAGSLIYLREGRQLVPKDVMAHRWDDNGYWILVDMNGEMTPVRYSDALTEEGRPMFEEQEFTEPPQITANQEQEQSGTSYPGIEESLMSQFGYRVVIEDNQEIRVRRWNIPPPTVPDGYYNTALRNLPEDTDSINEILSIFSNMGDGNYSELLPPGEEDRFDSAQYDINGDDTSKWRIATDGWGFLGVGDSPVEALAAALQNATYGDTMKEALRIFRQAQNPEDKTVSTPEGMLLDVPRVERGTFRRREKLRALIGEIERRLGALEEEPIGIPGYNEEILSQRLNNLQKELGIVEGILMHANLNGDDIPLASAPAPSMPREQAEAIVRNLGKVESKRPLNPRESAAMKEAQAVLRSAPAPSKQDALKEALKSMPPIWRTVLEASMKGTPVSQIATDNKISEVAVGNVLRVAQGRLRVLMEAQAGKLKPAVRVENEKVKAAAGRPDLAMSANPAFVAVDQRRAAPEEVTHQEMNELAVRMFDVDFKAAENLVVRWMDSGTTVLSTDGMPEGIKEAVQEAQSRRAAEMLMTAAAKMLVTQKALQGGDPIQTARLIDLYRNTGTEQARALNMRHDPFQTPEERAAMFIAEALLTPPESMRNEIRRNPANKERILARWAIESQKVKDALKAEGYDIDATFAALRREQAAAARAIPQEVKLPLAKATGRTQRLVKAVLEGMTWRQAAEAAKMTLQEAHAAYNAFREQVNQTGQQAAQAARDALLRSAPANDFAAQIGLPEWTDDASPDAAPVKTEVTEEIRKERTRKKQAGEIDLSNPTAVARTTQMMGPWKSSAFDKLSEFWRASILSGPQTHVVNLVSGMSYGLYDLTVKKAGTAVAADIARLFGVGTDAASLSDVPAMLAATVPAVKNALKDAVRAWKANDSFFSHYALDTEKKGGLWAPAIKGKKGEVIRTPFRLMLMADEFVKSAYTRIEVAAQARQIARNEGKAGEELAKRIQELLSPGSLAWARAMDKALEVTFQTELKANNRAVDAIDGLADLIQSAKKGRAGGLVKGISHFLFPFVLTPTNIFKAGVTMSPLGLGLSIVDATRAYNMRKAGNAQDAERLYSAGRFFDDLVNQVVGWGLAMIAWELVEPGEDEEALPFLTGSMPWRSTSKGERELAYRTAPPMSVRIGDRWMSYARLDPFASALSFTVDAVKAMKKDVPADEAWMEIGTSMMTAMQDKTFLQGFSDFLNALDDPKRFGTRWVTNIATGFVPNLIRQPIRSADDLVRENDLPNDVGFMEGLAIRVRNSTVPQMAVPAVDVWGRPESKGTGTGSPQTDFLLRLFSPMQTREISGVDPLDVALLRYNYKAEKPFGVVAPDREISKEFNGKMVKASLSDEEWEALMVKSGRAARLAIGSRFNGRDLKEEDVEVIKDIIARAQKTYRDIEKARKLRP